MSRKSRTSTNRRRLIKTLAVGGGTAVITRSLPDNWKRPVVDAVALPAHAQTSQLTGSFVDAQIQLTGINFLDSLVGTAYASYPNDAQVCINVVNGTATIQVLLGGCYYFSGPAVPLPFAGVSLAYDAGKSSCGATDQTVEISGMAVDNGGDVTIQGTLVRKAPSQADTSSDYEGSATPIACDLTPV